MLAPPNMPPLVRSPTGSWLATTANRGQLSSPTPDDGQINGTRSPPLDGGKRARQDKKRLSLAFLTKGVLLGEADKDRDSKLEKRIVEDNDTVSVTASTRSASKEINRHRLSLNFLHTAPLIPGSPAPEALPAFSSSNGVKDSSSLSSLGRSSSNRRPETSKSGKSGKSEGSKKESLTKRLSFMNISKKSSKSSVRGKQHDTLLEE